jgi:hypothetical protein
MVVFQHKHKKEGSSFLKILILEAYALPLSFHELNTKFEISFFNKNK